MVQDQDHGFKIKGGLFTEFVDQNKQTYDGNQANSSPKVKKVEKGRTSDFIKISPNFSKSQKSPSSTLEKAKEIIEKQNLYRIKNFFIKSGVLSKD